MKVFQAGHRIILVLCLVCYLPACAQHTIQVAVKTISKEVAGADIDILSIDAKKSHIRIIGWEQNVIKVELKLLAKNQKKEIAVKEVEYNQYQLKAENRTLFLRNFFYTTDNYPSVKSNLSAQYTVYVPQQKKIRIVNAYGEVMLKDVSGEITVTSKFSPVTIQSVSGTVSANLSYSDLTATQFAGTLVINGEKSNYSIQQKKGACRINGKYGEIVLFTEHVDEVEVKCDKTQVKIFVDQMNRYNYNLQTSHAAIQLPSEMKTEIETNGDKVTFQLAQAGKPHIDVTTSFSSININEI